MKPIRNFITPNVRTAIDGSFFLTAIPLVKGLKVSLIASSTVALWVVLYHIRKVATAKMDSMMITTSPSDNGSALVRMRTRNRMFPKINLSGTLASIRP